MKKSPERRAASARVTEAIQALADVLGPRACEHSPEWSECDEPDCDWESTKPVAGQVMLSEFVLMTVWTDFESGETFTARFYPVEMLDTHQKGLLHAGLYEFP